MIMAKQKPDTFINPKGHPRDRILVHENPNLPSEGLFVSLNGYSFQIPLGVPIDIPRPVRLMLDTRIQTEARTVFRGGDKIDVISRDIPRVPYVLLMKDVPEGLPLDAETPEPRSDAP